MIFSGGVTGIFQEIRALPRSLITHIPLFPKMIRWYTQQTVFWKAVLYIIYYYISYIRYMDLDSQFSQRQCDLKRCLVVFCSWKKYMNTTENVNKNALYWSIYLKYIVRFSAWGNISRRSVHGNVSIFIAGWSCRMEDYTVFKLMVLMFLKPFPAVTWEYICICQEKIQAPRHWPLWGEFTRDRWLPCTMGQ